MAKTYDQPIDKNIPWDGNLDTGNLPVRGSRIEEFLKNTLDTKVGVLYYDSTNNRYIAFADALTRDKYLEDPSLTSLVLGTFDAPFNYSAEITLESKSYNAISLGTTGNYIDFTFDVKNKNGLSTGESVICTYTFRRGSVKLVITELYASGKNVHFNIDKYLSEGTNTITIAIQGVTSLAATTAAITYLVVDLLLSTDLDISNVYNLESGSLVMAVPFTISGYGTKTVEWYLDGTKLDFVKDEDEVVDVSVSRTKYITLSNLSLGVHSLLIRAYTLVEGENFYSDTLYNEIIVYTRANYLTITAISTTIPSKVGIVTSRKLYGITLYAPYTLVFATYTPTSKASTEVEIKLNDVTQGVITSSNNTVNYFVIAPSVKGESTVQFVTEDSTTEIPADIDKTSMNISEITNALQLDFRAIGKSNNAVNKDQWSYDQYKGTFTGFNWNDTSGWVDNTLYLNSGASFGINIAPLSPNPLTLGKTIEIEFATLNVVDDNAIICDLRNENGTGLLITSTKVSLTSEAGTVIETPYKDNEFNRFTFVLNKTSGTTNKCMSFIYVNGKFARGVSWASTDKYTSTKQILFEASDKAEIKIKAIRIYDAALTSDLILNNYILYRDDVVEMNNIYERNDIYAEGTNTFDPEKMASRLPVMIITGNIPVLENTTNKNELIIVDVDYLNLLNPSLKFNSVSAAFRPLGTSSMGYPKKNFRLYSDKLASTLWYDSNGKLVSDRLYAFKEGALKVNCWCLKADYAESSGTHNTGIARLWNDVLYNATLDGEYVFRTEALKAALRNEFNYDVRTTIDGFPILLFYRLTSDDPLIFIGKYNFNNDKSTPQVFGFENIPGFSNTRMLCWEILNNGNPIALFNSVEDFDNSWSEAFESRYPDIKNPPTSDLKTFCTWMSSVSPTTFSTEKWEHLDVYKVAAYYIYLLRFGAVDLTVKNAMLTSEDGTKWFFINYDNDTINGLTNEGKLVVPWNAVRTTKGSDGEPYYAGSLSRLWNMLELDEEFMSIVRRVDEALYTAGLKYLDVIDMFDNQQASKWVERVYNQDALYKYIGPFIEDGVNNLFMLQGDRSTHRKYWLARRFNYFDSKFVSGAYKAQSIEIKCINNTPAGLKITITAGTEMDYGYGINNVVHASNIPLAIGDSHTFTTTETVNLGDPIRIYTAPNIQTLDLSAMTDRLAVLSIDKVYDESLGSKLKMLVIGNAVKENVVMESISGLALAEKLEYLDVRNMKGITSLDLSNQNNIRYVDTTGSNIANIEFAKGAALELFKMASAMLVLKLENLPYLIRVDSENNYQTLRSISIKNCPSVSKDFTFILNWMNNTLLEVDKLELEITGIHWTNVSPDDLISLKNLGSRNLKGTVEITTATLEQLDEISTIFGSKCFERDSEFRVIAPDGIFISSPNSVRGGNNIEFTAAVFSENVGSVSWSIISGSGASITSSSGFSCVVKTTESSSDRTFTIQAKHTPTVGDIIYITKVVTITKVTRVTSGSISGPVTIGGSGEYTFTPSPSTYDEPYTVTWSLTGTAATSGYVSIISQNNETCKVLVNQAVSASTFSVVATVNNGKSSFSVTKSVATGVKFVLYITSNLPSESDTFNNVSATVKYGSSSTSMKNGLELSVAANTTIKVTFPSVTNYKTPSIIEFVLGEEDVTKTGTYLAERVEVNVSANDNDDITGVTVTINSVNYTLGGSSITAMIPFDTTYTIKGGYKLGYVTPTLESFTASLSSRLVNLVYEATPKDTIIIDLTISDPDTMISGEVNNDTIKAIRAGSHRYLGKYVSEGNMTLCLLDDNDSTKFVDGTDADLTGSMGDVFMKMPNFFYRSLSIDGDDIVGLLFKLGTESPGEEWNEWNTNTLIGAYEAYYLGSKLYSYSNKSSVNSITHTGCINSSRARGKGFQIVDWQMHCVMAILFYALYGHTNCLEKIGSGMASYSEKTGQTNTCGMNDTAGTAPVTGLNDLGQDGNTMSINYWGLENWWGNKLELVDNVITISNGLKVTESDGSVFEIKVPTYNSYIRKINLGKKCNIVPKGSSYGDPTTGFCDCFFYYGSPGRVVYRGYYGADAYGGLSCADASANASNSSTIVGSRLAFRGNCTIEEDTTTFKSLEAIS